MRVFCSGFNLYGQFIKCPTLIIEEFVDYSCNATLFEPSHTFNLAVTSDGVYVHGSKNDKTHQVQKIINPGFDIKQVACFDTKILILYKNGDLFKCDFNTGALTYINKNMKKVSCNATVNIALSNDGSVFNLPSEIHFTNNGITDVASGREHYLMLDKIGKVYTCGRGSRGQLGHGDLEDELEPKIVEALDGIKIDKIAAGGWHSCAISAQGDLYVWGWNGNGQLGLYNNAKESISVMAVPQVVNFDDQDANIMAVACGHRHTIALLDDKRLYGTGWNRYCQLGKVTQETNLYRFEVICDLRNLDVKELKCGPWSSLVICL
ncbi:hypothetical protein RN001_011490 [Aquatica leii]|uniref:RCC1 domain-containing protein 1 n=1 Tax=Aquatica leii TaxID=1421715 RepID=A0AAN7SM17_9COLE|nr:hypothetical protein RN001_011490 [Aquatica leii]